MPLSKQSLRESGGTGKCKTFESCHVRGVTLRRLGNMAAWHVQDLSTACMHEQGTITEGERQSLWLG